METLTSALCQYCCKTLCVPTNTNFQGRTRDDLIMIYIVCDELTGEFGKGLEKASVDDFGLLRPFAGNWPHPIFGVLQHYLPDSDMS